MQTLYKSYRYLVLRRISQTGLLLLFIGGNYFGWNILKGNFSSAILFNKIPLSDPYAVLQTLFSGFIVTSDLLIGSLIVLFIYGLLFGRIFCSWICPINLISDFASYISKIIKLERNFVVSKKIRYFTLVIGLVLSTILGLSAFEAISPISIFHRGIIFGIGSGWTVILAIFLFDLVATKNGWCGHLCPLGAFYSVVGRFAILKVMHKKDNCTNCLKCFDVCHEPQVLSIINKSDGIIKSGECSNCARCIEICEDNALNFSLSNTLKKNEYETH